MVLERALLTPSTWVRRWRTVRYHFAGASAFANGAEYEIRNTPDSVTSRSGSQYGKCEKVWRRNSRGLFHQTKESCFHYLLVYGSMDFSAMNSSEQLEHL